MPGDQVRRPNRKKHAVAPETEAKMVEVIRESVPMKDEVSRPEYVESEQLRYAKWKIKMAYGYLAFTTTICLGAILLNPVLDVRLVVLALWNATSAVLAVVLRREYKRTL
jgi:hypothetical protein